MTKKETAHSPIGASIADRWMNCPGSVRLSKDIPKTTSKYAEEGTYAHAVAADVLLEKKDPWPQGISDEMVSAIQTYTGVIYEDLGNLGEKKLFVETAFHLSELHEDLWGTTDAAIYNPRSKFLQIYDFKYGAGVAVDVDDNVQLKYYALGALLEFKLAAQEIELIIVQPRCAHPDGIVRRYRFDSFELLDFAADLREKALETEKPDAILFAGAHCKWCPAAGVCPEIHNKAKELMRSEFKLLETKDYSPEKLSEVLTWLPVISAWVTNVRQFAYGEAAHGVKVPGFKLVAKRATRKWVDEDKLRLFVDQELRNPLMAYDHTLKTPAQMEKVIDKKVLEPFIVSVSSGVSLVPEADRRPEIKNVALLDLELIEEGEE